MGDLLLDVVARADGGLRPGSDVAGTVRFRAGGSAANVARAFARLGGRSVLVCAVGRDAWATRLVAAARADGVTLHAVRVDGPTGRLLALVDGAGERTFVTERAAADGLRAAHLKQSWFRGAGALHVPAYGLLHPVPLGACVRAAGFVRAAVEEGSGAGAVPLVSVDLASAGPLADLGPAVALERIGALAPDVLFANRDEAAVLGGRRGRWAPLLEVAPLVVIKEGGQGSRVLWRWRSEDGHQELEVATTAIDAADTTGAGDAFAAGFLRTLIGARGREGGVPWRPAELRRAALAGHRSASELLRRPRTGLLG
ncbi:MAG: carbohydrate kinase family protein [Chloroflexi bacterium]|nr:carbohydrate kinase family protein [Chloroflexota bacterium]